VHARILAARNRSARRASSKDTRRKILLGRFFLRKHLFDGTLSELLRLLDPFLTRPADRNIFGLDAAVRSENLDGLSLKGVILIGALYLELYKDNDRELLEKIRPILKRSSDVKLFERANGYQTFLPEKLPF
jgi:hypothetical protein